jgi:hypothetical protein
VSSRGIGVVRLAAWAALASAARVGTLEGGPAPIDRRAVVTRHNPVLRELDPEAPLSVGNGEFAFTADLTGLQTFAEAYEDTTPLATLAQWGWHTSPNPQGWSIETFRHAEFESRGRRVGYADIPGDRRTPEIEWLRANPHRLHLGRVAFRLLRRDGREAASQDLSDVEQTLDLWNGALLSGFRLDGEPVVVEALCHPRRDLLAVRVRSELLRRGRIALRVSFPYGTGAAPAADWSQPAAHTTRVRLGARAARFERRLDADAYEARAAWTGAARLAETAAHEYVLSPGTASSAFEFAIEFAPPGATDNLPNFEATRALARRHWNRFWRSGGAIDLSGSKDPRWRELERRIVLSQYLAAIQCAGRYPPQETGLTFNSWEGKFHLEMHLWHAEHFALRGRLPLLRGLGRRARALRARPPLQCAQEVFPKESTVDCGFELVYWRFGLETAQRWRERLGLPRSPRWDEVLARLAGPAVEDGKYLFARSAPLSYRDPRWARDHPAVLAALGLLPGPGVDPDVMRRTLAWIVENWNWAETWGWDYAMVAMTAARLGEPHRAIDALLMDTPKNRYRRNGHNHQRPGLTVYLPGNGALLYAVALMAAGWDGAPAFPAPAFPADGSWRVRFEGLRRAP